MHKNLFISHTHTHTHTEMGKITSQSAEPTTIHHFSHPHPLHLSTLQPHQTLTPSPCSACKLPTASSALIYTCQTCPYLLHTKCSQLPQQISHPFHQTHIFSLLPTPLYPEGLFSCDACGKQGNGFSYHCKPCGIDLHVGCASMPLSISHQSHHHPLNLVFSSPYGGFCCDICKQTGGNHWVYRCGMCDFDAHLDCGVMKSTIVAPIQAPIQPIQMQQQYQTPLAPPIQPIQMQQQYQTPLAPPFQATQMQNFQTPSRAAVAFQALGNPYLARPNYVQNYPQNNMMNYGNQGAFGSVPPPMANGQNNVIMNQAIQGLASGFSQAAGQQLFQSLMGSGGGGSGGGGGGSGHLLHGLMGGGSGGSQDIFGGNGSSADGSTGGSQDIFGGDGGGGDGSGFDGSSFVGFDDGSSGFQDYSIN